jgi:hypothetical protein
MDHVQPTGTSGSALVAGFSAQATGIPTKSWSSQTLSSPARKQPTEYTSFGSTMPGLTKHARNNKLSEALYEARTFDVPSTLCRARHSTKIHALLVCCLLYHTCKMERRGMELVFGSSNRASPRRGPTPQFRLGVSIWPDVPTPLGARGNQLRDILL